MTRGMFDRARFGPYEVDLQTRELWKFGTRLKLIGQPFEILTMLLRRSGELVTREEMRSRLWPSDTFVDFNHGLNAAVNKLREALSDSAESPRYIETLPRRGYRFIAEVEWLDLKPAHKSGPEKESVRLSVADSVPEFASAPELHAQSFSTQIESEWVRYFVGAGVMFTLVIIFCLIVVLHGGFRVPKASAEHAALEHTRPLLTIADTSTPAFSPDGNSVAFFRERTVTGEAGIYVVSVGGDHPLQLTTGDRDCCPVWSPDGRSIAFTREVGHVYSIHVVAADGSSEQKRQAGGVLAGQLTASPMQRIVAVAAKESWRDREIPTGGIAPARPGIDWSPNGGLIAFSGADGLYAVSPDGSALHRITTAPPLTQDWGPEFSPDGSQMLFVQDHQSDLSNEILLVSVAGGECKHVYSERGRIASPPKWSYDGRSVIFSSNRTGHPALWRIALDSPNKAVQVSEAGSPAWDPDVSRRGYRLAYEHLLRSLSIWQMDLSVPDKPLSLLISGTSDTDQGPGPQFSPDGRKVAYMSDRSGTMEIWVANRDGSNPFQLSAVGGAGTPRWSPDSQSVVFDVATVTGPKIVVMGLRGGAPQILADGEVPSFSRDGKWVYFASARTRDWQVWKVPVIGGSAIQVTHQGGHAALESLDGKFLYYAKNPGPEPEIWQVPAEGGEETALPLVRPGSWASWQITKNGILFVGPSLGHQAVLSFYDFARDRTTEVAVLNRIPFWLGATPDGKSVAFDQPGQEQDQAMLVDNFR
ncbi:MAG TPA: winged helix-turn-helix domain-containing protein [Verrucomicrobiae bacterium]|nr:winged helix-turn-helix domain-containing protein [Verrucomicrobiae bacterium]